MMLLLFELVSSLVVDKKEWLSNDPRDLRGMGSRVPCGIIIIANKTVRCLTVVSHHYLQIPGIPCWDTPILPVGYPLTCRHSRLD